MFWPFPRANSSTYPQTVIVEAPQPRMRYCVEFASHDSADEAALRIRRYDFAVEVRASRHDKGKWLVLAEESLPDSKEFLDHRAAIVKAVAGATRGRYQGWEAGPMPDDETAATLHAWHLSGAGAPDRARSYA